MERRASAASFRAYQSDSLAPPTSVVNEIRDGTAQVLTFCLARFALLGGYLADRRDPKSVATPTLVRLCTR